MAADPAPRPTAGDGRLPVVVGEPWQTRPGDLIVPAPPPPAPLHTSGCACCAPRAVLAQALTRAFLASVRGSATPGARILVTGASAREVAEAIDADVLASARLRFAGAAGA